MLGQHRRRSARAAKRSFDVHVENLVPYFISQPVEIGEINPMRYAGIIDQYVQASELPADLLDHIPDLCIALDIALNR
jgi:hypothetical protein